MVARSDPPVLQAHNNTDIILRLPMGKRIKDIRWLSVWCRRFTVSPSILPLFLDARNGTRRPNRFMYVVSEDQDHFVITFL